MGEIADAIEARRTDGPCSLVRKIEEIEASGKCDEADMAALWKAADDPRYSAYSLSRVMGRLGYTLHRDTVERHRGHGDCRSES